MLNNLAEPYHQKEIRRKLAMFKTFSTTQSPKTGKALQRYLGSVKYFMVYILGMVLRPNSIYRLLQAETPVNLTSELRKIFDSVNTELSDACIPLLEQLLAGRQLVMLTDASFRCACLAFKIEDNRGQKKKKTYAPMAFGSKIICTTCPSARWIF